MAQRPEEEPPRSSTAGSEAGLLTASSSGHPDLTLVIPTMDEAAGIGECIDRAAAAFRELGVTGEIIVSDSSTDETPEIARERGAKVVTPGARGYGNAYLHAFEHARGDLIAMGDGDTTYDFAELPKLVRRLEETEADIVLGSRLEGDIVDGAMPWLHERVGNPALTAFLNVFYDAGVTDAHSGMRVFRRDLLDDLELRAEGMEFASEMIMRASARGKRIEEVPITYHERTGDATLQTFSDGWRHVKFMLVNAPGRLFSVPAAGFLAVGVAAMLLSLVGGEGIVGTPHAAVAGALFTVIGYQLGVLGFVSSIVADPIQKPEDIFTEYLRGTFQLEGGLAVGSVVLLAGGVFALFQVITWYTTGVPPAIAPSVVALTTITLGLQTVFQSFFLSMLGRTTGTERSMVADDREGILGGTSEEAD